MQLAGSYLIVKGSMGVNKAPEFHLVVKAAWFCRARVHYALQVDSAWRVLLLCLSDGARSSTGQQADRTDSKTDVKMNYTSIRQSASVVLY